MFPELSDCFWIHKLAFFSDLTTQLGKLSRSLQSGLINVWQSFELIPKFKMKLELLKSEFQDGNFKPFSNLVPLKLFG